MGNIAPKKTMLINKEKYSEGVRQKSYLSIFNVDHRIPTKKTDDFNKIINAWITEMETKDPIKDNGEFSWSHLAADAPNIDSGVLFKHDVYFL